MKKFRIKVWKKDTEQYCVQILEQPDDSRGIVYLNTTTGFTISSCSNPAYRNSTKEIFLRGTIEYLDFAILSIPKEDFSVFMKSLKEFCEHFEWEFDYEFERNFGNL